MKQPSSIQRLRRNNPDGIVPYLFIAPFLITFIMFFAYPAGYSLVLSFFKYKGYGAATFVGFRNFQSLLGYSPFLESIKNTLFYFLAHLIPVMGGAFLFALLLQSKALGLWQKVFKPILFLPQVIPVMASVLTFNVIFASNSGAVNQLFGLDIRWLEDPTIMRWTVVILVVWRSIGWFMIVFLTGLTTINPSLYEAAKLDGASNLQQTVRITIPLMKPIFLFAFIMDAIGSFKIFTEVNVLLARIQDAPTYAAPIMNMVTINLRNGSFGTASAAGWLLFLLVFVISVAELFLMRNQEE